MWSFGWTGRARPCLLLVVRPLISLLRLVVARLYVCHLAWPQRGVLRAVLVVGYCLTQGAGAHAWLLSALSVVFQSLLYKRQPYTSNLFGPPSFQSVWWPFLCRVCVTRRDINAVFHTFAACDLLAPRLSRRPPNPNADTNRRDQLGPLHLRDRPRGSRCRGDGRARRGRGGQRRRLLRCELLSLFVLTFDRR